MSNTSHQPTTATRVTDPDSDPSRATSYHVTKTSPPCQTKCRPHPQSPPQTAAHRVRQIRLIGMAEGQRVVSSPGSPSRSSQRGASRPPRAWRARPTGVLVIDCFSRALSTGCAGWCDWDRGQRWLGVAVVDVRAPALLPSRLHHYSGTHCSSRQLDAIHKRERLRSAIGMLPTMSRRRWSTPKRASGGVHFSAKPTASS